MSSLAASVVNLHDVNKTAGLSFNATILQSVLIVDYDDADPMFVEDAETQRNIERELHAGVEFTLYHPRNKPLAVQLVLESGGHELALYKRHSDDEIESISLRGVDEIRFGHKTTGMQTNMSSIKPSHSFSLIYGKVGCLDLVASDTKKRNRYAYGLRSLIQRAKKCNVDIVTLQHLWYSFPGEEKNLSQVKHLLREMNMLPSGAKFEELVKTLDVDNSGTLDIGEFLQLSRWLTARPELTALFAKYAKTDAKQMTDEEFAAFWQHEQKPDKATEAADILQSFRPSGMNGVSEALFQEILSSLTNEPLRPISNTVHQDMTQPITHYWWMSSHNTYLQGDQLQGLSSVEMYSRVLKYGCRCVELDCWDGADGEPIVTHGNTACGKISFRHVCEAIRDYAFVTSPYPLCLSLENHCSVQQQARMAFHLEDVLRDLLAETLVDSDATQLPSPHDLRFKVLLKGGVQSEVVVEYDKDGNAKESKVKVASELSRLIYLKSTSFKSFEDHKVNGKCWEVTSFTESAILKKDEADFQRFNGVSFSRVYPKGTRFGSDNYDAMPGLRRGCQLVALNLQSIDKHSITLLGKFRDNGGCGFVLKPDYMRGSSASAQTKKTVVTIKVMSGRVFPKHRNEAIGTKAMATATKALEHGKDFLHKFTDSGSKKKKKSFFSKLSSNVHTMISEKTEGDDQSVLDPSVVVRMNGAECDIANYETKVIRDNGFDPEFNETFQFVVQRPELAVMTIAVQQNSRSLLQKDKHYCEMTACNAFPVQGLRPGFRMVHFYCAYTNKVVPLASLLCHIDIR